MVCESVGKADLLSDHIDSEQSREAVIKISHLLDFLVATAAAPALITIPNSAGSQENLVQVVVFTLPAV